MLQWGQLPLKGCLRERKLRFRLAPSGFLSVVYSDVEVCRALLLAWGSINSKMSWDNFSVTLAAPFTWQKCTLVWLLKRMVGTIHLLRLQTLLLRIGVCVDDVQTWPQFEKMFVVARGSALQHKSTSEPLPWTIMFCSWDSASCWLSSRCAKFSCQWIQKGCLQAVHSVPIWIFGKRH